MSKVELVVWKRNELAFGTLVKTNVALPEDVEIRGVVRTDFDTNEQGETRTGDDIALVISMDDVNNLVGKMITLTDAMTNDPEQRKALKDLVTNTVWTWENNRSELLSRSWRHDRGFETSNPIK